MLWLAATDYLHPTDLLPPMHIMPFTVSSAISSIKYKNDDDIDGMI